MEEEELGTGFWTGLLGGGGKAVRGEDTIYQCVGKHAPGLVLLDEVTGKRQRACSRLLRVQGPFILSQ